MSGNQNGVNNIDNATTSVVIVGAGPVGMLLALKLGKANIDVTVIEKESTTAEDPRAIGYYAASALALLDAGVYHKILDEGFTMKGLCWRKKPVDDGKGGKRLGDVIAAMPLADLDDDVMPPGTGMLCLQQALLTRLLVREALSTGHVMLLFNRALCDIEEGDETVTAITRDTETGDMHKIVASFLVGTDGGRSTTRELLKIPFPGHTWPERLLATNVMVPNIVDPTFPCHFVLDPINYTITTPLTPLVLGETTLWRCTMATDPKDTRSDEEMLKDEHIASLYEKVMAGPRPLKYEIKQRSMYRIHQRLAPTLRRGRSVLAGDAAHVCNPYGALGLNSGILDADALAEALVLILNESKPLALLDVYSDERRKVFQFFVDPTSTHNKLRVQTNDQDTADRDDWFFRTMRTASKEEMMELSKPFFETWRTDMRKLAQGL